MSQRSANGRWYGIWHAAYDEPRFAVYDNKAITVDHLERPLSVSFHEPLTVEDAEQLRDMLDQWVKSVDEKGGQATLP